MRLLARAVRVRPGLQVFGADSPEFCFVKALWSEPAAANIVDLLAATAASLPRPEMLLHCSSADCSCPQNVFLSVEGMEVIILTGLFSFFLSFS
jgi:hypothetical protein